MRGLGFGVPYYYNIMLSTRLADHQNLVSVVPETRVQTHQGSIARIRDPEQRAIAGHLDEQLSASHNELDRVFSVAFQTGFCDGFAKYTNAHNPKP